MSELGTPAAQPGVRTAGGLIREAREAQGVQIGTLAAAIKVSQQKLEWLEADRIDELPDATFVRALAQTVCRSLKIDPVPVLALLPRAGGHRLDQISEGINAPFRDRPGRRGESGDTWLLLARPAVWGPGLLVLAALMLYVAPAGWLSALTKLPRTAPAQPAATAGAALPVAAATSAGDASPAIDTPAKVETVFSAPPPSELAASASSAAAAAAVAGSSLQLRANAESWVEVVDARSRVLLSRMLQPGETVALEGTMPMRLKVGNAAGTEAVFRGQVLDLAGSTRDNVARLELK